ncbi:MAG: GNAT family N-acetyltransferase [Candidatus Sericytochromatia bacterium]
MENIIIKKANINNSDLITKYLKKMLLDMNEYGGYTVSSSEKAWIDIEEKIKCNFSNKDYIYLLAEDNSTSKVIGYSEAKILESNPIFEKTKQLHISAVFVEKDYRKKGIGKIIINELIKIAKDNNCQEIDLNVLLNNDAYFLYKSLGFEDFRVNMIKKII